jgi:F-type H+-transporting ATPase subunit a
MLASISAVFAFILPIPIMLYELFVGVIQATIFALLTMAFMAILTTPHNAEAHSRKEVSTQ